VLVCAILTAGLAAGCFASADPAAAAAPTCHPATPATCSAFALQAIRQHVTVTRPGWRWAWWW
jgi:hypothetical protein